ncbi:TolC family protein [Roseinatronobacter sp.]
MPKSWHTSLLPYAAIFALALAGCAPAPADDDDLVIELRPDHAPQQAQRTQSLASTSFGQTVADAVRSYPTLAAGSARIRAAEAQLEGESGAFLPQVSIGAETGMRHAGNTRATRSSPVLEIRQLVFDGGQSSQRTEAARARIAQSANDRMAQAAAVTLNAVEAWHEVLHHRALVDLAARNMRLHTEFLGQTQDRVGAGAGAETDLLTARSRLADAEARQITAQSKLDRAEAEFRQIFGRSPGALSQPASAPTLPGTAESIAIDSPRLRSVDASIRAAQAELQAARAGNLPNVGLGVTGRSTNGRADIGANLSLQYDLATGGRRKAAIRTAEARVMELEAERDDLNRQITRALDFVQSDQRAGAHRLRAARQARTANEANVGAVRDQFGIGRRSITELLDAQRDFIRSSEGVLEAELDLALSGYLALSLTGDILDVFGIHLPPPEAARR